MRISKDVKKNRPLGGGPTSHILPGASVQLRQVESDRRFYFMPTRCLLSSYSMPLQAGGDFDRKFDLSVDLVVVVSL